MGEGLKRVLAQCGKLTVINNEDALEEGLLIALKQLP